ncbi:MarR family transcriptional regulator [Streptomyces sp. TRM43335]|uniref:MarR family transcriptional regulator n=1 Tax=Streptomyces taklimakanensis TaxID=2569853 RepID=A0A6G2B9X0_9ACTN|nr:MarR family transcriptional regulator [Streptomyces taklimakanensis]MTE18926.1 MarR family transcriptional regulator [Streptomyces taklimakanensis]
MTSRTAPADRLTLEVVELIGTVVDRFHREYDEAAGRHSLTGSQARLIALLHHRPLPMREIARRLKCEPSNITGIVDRLESRGLVERRPDPADRRVKLAALTERGLDTAERLRGSLDFAREPLGELTPVERAVLRDLLRRMLGAGSAEDAPEGGAEG